LVRNPLAVAREAPKCCSVYYGVISNLGVMLWMAAAAICLFTALMAYTARAGSARTGLFVAGGLFTLWLGIDDFFLVHEEVLPQVGIPQIITYAAYAATGLVYLFVAWRFILTSRLSLFLVAGFGLAGSMGLDAIVDSEAPFWVFLEDGLKFVGIAFWVGFHVSAAVALAEELATGRVTSRPLTPEPPVRRLVSNQG
jgi:hypothetical protein